MKKIKIAIIAIMGVSLGIKAQDFESLNTNFGNIEWKTSRWGNGFGHKIYGSDPGGKTLLNIASRHNSETWIDLMTFTSNGRVGIGTTSPSQKLDVNGHIKFDALGSGHTNIQIGHDTNDRIFADNSSNKSYGGGIFFRITPDPSLSIQHNYIDVMMLTDKGKVGIGTKNTGTHKLAVEGSIGAREIKVEAYPNWSDFVFEKSYNLPTLKEVEEHIKEKGHLKDIPNAEEIKKNGFFLGEMDAKLLQKIEELTLYTIEQEKKLKIQEKKIDALEKKNSEIEELKSLVQKLLKDKN
jgi:hypothetical protein